MIERLYATKVDTRMPYPFVSFRIAMKVKFGDPVGCIEDFTDDYTIIFLVTCTATDYEKFKRNYDNLSEWIEFDYFNQNKIEE